MTPTVMCAAYCRGVGWGAACGVSGSRRTGARAACACGALENFLPTSAGTPNDFDDGGGDDDGGSAAIRCPRSQWLGSVSGRVFL